MPDLSIRTHPGFKTHPQIEANPLHSVHHSAMGYVCGAIMEQSFALLVCAHRGQQLVVGDFSWVKDVMEGDCQFQFWILGIRTPPVLGRPRYLDAAKVPDLSIKTRLKSGGIRYK